MGIAYDENFDAAFGLDGKNAIITGAASGIGEAIARMFAKKAANVALADVNSAVYGVEADIRRGSGGVKTLCLVGDITDRTFRAGIVENVSNAFGGIDILVNCAGIALLEEAEELPEDYWDKTMDVNLKAAFMLSQAVGRYMIKNGGGKIINIASQASVVSLDRHVAYCASKAGLVSVTQVLAAEWAEYGINVNAISPTVVLTELGKKAWAGAVGENMKKLIPAGRFGYPEEIAACAAYLASGAANLITGTNIVIDGGYTIK